MKGYRVVLAAIVMVALSACTFDAPLVAEPSLPIDKALVGSWQLVPEADDPDATPERIVVKQSSANEYVIEHIADDSVIYFSGWLAELHGIRFVQLEVTGDDEGPVAAGDTDLFSVFSFELTGNDLVVRSLNTELVDQNLPDTNALQEAFEKNKDQAELFIEPGRFRRI